MEMQHPCAHCRSSRCNPTCTAIENFKENSSTRSLQMSTMMRRARDSSQLLETDFDLGKSITAFLRRRKICRVAAVAHPESTDI